MALEEIENLYNKCIKEYKLTTEEAVQQIVIAGVSSIQYSEWIKKYHLK